MRADFKAAFSDNPPLVYAAGHEPSPQLHCGDGYGYNLVSDAAIERNLTKVVPLDETIFCRSASGLIRLDMALDGRVRLSVHVAKGQGGRVSEVYATMLEIGPRDTINHTKQ